jgi:hypothetical protein
MIEAPAIALTVRIFCERQLRRSGPPPTSIDISRAFAPLPSKQPTTSLSLRATFLFALLSFGTRQAEIPDLVLIAAECSVNVPTCAWNPCFSLERIAVH